MRLFALSFFLVVFLVAEQNRVPHGTARLRTESLLTYCADDGASAFIPDAPAKSDIALVGDIKLRAGFRGQGDEGATFEFVRGDKTLFSFTAEDLYSDSVWVTASGSVHAGLAFEAGNVAITYSDGGAVGGFHVRVFHIEHDLVTDVSVAINGAVVDFRKRHYCRPRGNNVTALKWVGHTEGYRVSVPDGKIQEHLTLEQLKRYPGICLQNDGNPPPGKQL
jgi:hypothetical protein